MRLQVTWFEIHVWNEDLGQWDFVRATSSLVKADEYERELIASGVLPCEIRTTIAAHDDTPFDDC